MLGKLFGLAMIASMTSAVRLDDIPIVYSDDFKNAMVATFE